jgi:hypothetical protein
VPITTKVVSSNPVHGKGVLDITLHDKVCERLATGWWFSPFSSTNKTYCHDIHEILSKVALNTINQLNHIFGSGSKINMLHNQKVYLI